MGKVKRRVIIDLIAEVDDNEDISLLYKDIESELSCCWHMPSFSMREVVYNDKEELND